MQKLVSYFEQIDWSVLTQGDIRTLIRQGGKEIDMSWLPIYRPKKEQTWKKNMR